ncbi:MAG: hypothetical protein KDG44_05640 [Burkholderiaceae bacterium]|nr:hypothetical protein [Burkholderiaceae bacterium]
MAAGSNAFYTQQYASAVELLAQQMTPRVASAFTPMTGEGKAATAVNQIDAFEADERTGLYDPVTFGAPTHNRPWVYPRHFDKAIPFDSIEQMQMNANPQSEYVQGVVAAINRKMDDEAIRAFFAARNMGESGTSVDNFNTSTNQVGVSVGGTTSGLNVEKLQNAIQIFEENEIDLDMEQIYCVISPKQKRNLMNEIEVTSGDFFKGQVMSTRQVNGFLSINFIVSNRLLTDSSSYRRVPIFTPKGMTFATWGGLQTTVSQRQDLRGHPWQVYGQGHFGAVRRDAKRVIEIQCSEA